MGRRADSGAAVKGGLARSALFLAVALALAPAVAAAAPAATIAVTDGGVATDSGKQAEGHYRLPPEKRAQALAYSRAKYILYFAESLWGMALLWALLALRASARLRDLAARVSAHRSGQVWIFGPLFILLFSVLSLPLGIYGHVLARRYGQSVQGWGSYALDWSKGQLLALLIGTLLLWLLYAVIAKSERRWWLYFWLAAVPVVLFMMFIEPLVIEPLFFRFKPLAETQPALTAQLHKVVERGGLEIPSSHMFLMEASEKLKSVNAYVTGLGASKRVVVWDTTVASMTTPEISFVFGHELGHYVLGHVVKSIAFMLAGLLLVLYLAHRAMGWALRRWGARWEVRGCDDWAALPLLLLIVTIFSFLSAPIQNGFSRYFEHQADVFGLEVTHGIVPDPGSVAAQAFQTLGEIDLADPAPSTFIKYWLYDHPPLEERIAFARSYDPWSAGRAPQFVP
jgi:Zn-dependent protease with chaperone function